MHEISKACNKLKLHNLLDVRKGIGDNRSSNRRSHTMLMTPPRCWRKRRDCEPFHSVEGLPEGMDEAAFERLETGKMNPDSFVCCGCVSDSQRAVPQDAYRVCWKNSVVDEMGEYDEQDLTHTMAVISQALAIVATRRTNSGMIAVPTMLGGHQPTWWDRICLAATALWRS